MRTVCATLDLSSGRIISGFVAVHHHSPHSRSCVAYCRVYSDGNKGTLRRYGVQQRKRSRSISYIFAASIVNTLVMLLGKCVASLGSLAWHQGQSAYPMITSDGGVFVFIFVACGLVCVLNVRTPVFPFNHHSRHSLLCSNIQVHLVNKALESGDALRHRTCIFRSGTCLQGHIGYHFFQWCG